MDTAESAGPGPVGAPQAPGGLGLAPAGSAVSGAGQDAAGPARVPPVVLAGPAAIAGGRVVERLARARGDVHDHDPGPGSPALCAVRLREGGEHQLAGEPRRVD